MVNEISFQDEPSAFSTKLLTQTNSAKESKSKDVVVLEFIKYDFYKKNDDILNVSVYVKNIDKNSLVVKFGKQHLSVEFQTCSKEFLKLHKEASESTVFLWNVTLRHCVDTEKCRYAHFQTKLAITLAKACSKDNWNALEELNSGALRSNVHQGTTQTKKMANGVLVNGIFARQEDDKNRMKLENRNASFNYRVEEQEQEKRLSIASFGVPSSLGDSNHSLKSSFNGTGENHSLHYKPGPVKLSSNRCDSNGTNDTPTELKRFATTLGKSEKTTSERDKLTHPEEIQYDSRIHECRPGSTGLLNPGNLCYINSVVQCLSSVIELRNLILSKRHRMNINRNNKNGYGGELIATFESLMQDMWSGKRRVISASKLKDILGKKKKQFEQFGQQDAQEFFTYLVDGLHEDLKACVKKTLSDIETKVSGDILKNSRLHWDKYTNGNNSVISDLFQGQSISEIQCKDCGT